MLPSHTALRVRRGVLLGLLGLTLAVAGSQTEVMGAARGGGTKKPAAPLAAPLGTPRAVAVATGKTGERVLMMEVTAYCPCKICCGKRAKGLTASGQKVGYNRGAFVAADTDLLPFHTKVSIPGYKSGKPVPVMDRGGDIVGNRIDVFFPTHKEAMKWGRQMLAVKVEE